MDDIKQKLLEMQEAIINNIEQERDKSVSAISGDIGDEIDHANEDRNRELYQLLCERDQKKLEQIQYALESIRNETYGICEDCGEKINRKRLIALPFAKMCIDCKSEEERTKGIGVHTRDENYSSSDKGRCITFTYL